MDTPGSSSSGEPRLSGDSPTHPAGLAARLRAALTRMLGESAQEPSPPVRHPLLWIAAVVVVLVGVLSYLYLRLQVREARERVEAELTAVAELKVGQINAWRAERLGDARAVMQLPFLREDLAQAPDGAALGPVVTYFEELRAAYGYDSIALVNPAGTILTSVPATPATAARLDLPRELPSSQKPCVRDLYRGTGGGVYIEFWSPLLAGESHAFVGAVRLRVDARERLFPIVQSWPMPSETAEALLLRRDGERVVALTDLRFQPGAALASSRRIDKPDLLGARAIIEKQLRLTDGIDYRDEPVLGVSRAIEGSDWVLVAKIDCSEAYEGVRYEAWRVGVGLAVLVTLGFAGLGLFWRHQRLRFEFAQQAAERQRRTALERLGLVLQHANDVLLLFDEEMRIVEANERVETVYGRTVPEMLTLTAYELRAPGSRGTIEVDFHEALDAGKVFQTEHCRKDGTVFPVEVSTRWVLLGGRRLVLSIVRDITERKEREEEIGRLGRMYRVLSEVNHSIAHRKTMAELFADLCRSLVDTGQFSLAWVGWHNQQTRTIEAAAVAGDTYAYVPQIRVSSDASVPEGRGPSGTAFREGRTYVCNDFMNSPVTVPWRAAAAQSGIASSAAIPIRVEGAPQGLLTVYSSRPGFFGPREVALLEETAADVSFALDVMLGESRRHEAEAALRSSEERHRALFENMDLGVIYFDADGRITSANPAASAITGRPVGQFIGHTLSESGWQPVREDGTRYHDDSHPVIIALRTGQRIHGVVMGFTRENDHQQHWILADAVPEFRPGEDKPHRAFAIFADITDRLHGEIERRKLSRAVDQAPVSIIITDLTGAIEYVNPRFTESSGYTFEEVVGKNPREFKSNVVPLAVYRDLWDTITRGEVWRGELVNRKKNGELRTELVVITPVTDTQGRATHYVALREDISDRKRIEENLRKLSRAIDQAPVSVVITDLNGTIEYVNPTFTEVSGYTLDEVRGRNPRVLKSGLTPPEVHKEMWTTLAAGQVWRGEVCNRKKNGAVHDEYVVIAPVVNEAGNPTHYVALKVDITAQKRTADQLRRSRDRLATAEAMAHLGNWETELETHQTTWSDEVFRIFEVDPATPNLAEAFRTRVHPDDLDRLDHAQAEARARHTGYTLSYRLQFPDGRTKYVEVSTEVAVSPQGKPLRAVGTIQDITDRKLVELELHELVKALRAFHAVSQVVEDRTLDTRQLLGRMVRHLPGAVRVPVLAQAEIRIGTHRALAGASGARVHEISAAVLVNGSACGTVCVGYVAGRASRPPEFVVQEREFVESVARTLGLAIGERESDEQVRRSEERFRAIFDNAEVGMFEATTDGHITRANRFLGTLLGTGPKARVGRHWSEFLAEPNGAGAPPIAAREIQCHDATGRVFWGLLKSKLEHSVTGDAVGHLCLLQDISAQVAARETLVRFNVELEAKVALRTAELDARNREIQGLLQANPDMVLRLRSDGTVVHCQRAQGSGPLSKLDCRRTHHAEAGPESRIKDESLALGIRALAENATLNTEFDLGVGRGTCSVELRAAPIGPSDFVVFVRDITARRRLEAETAAMLEKERQISDMKTRFISVTSHEFRTPMAAMLGSVELLTNHFDRITPAKRSELLERIAASIARMTEMLDDVLTLNRMDAKRTEVRLAPVELHSLAESLVEEIRDADRGAHHIVLSVEPATAEAVTDSNLLRHIVSNLLSNAVRYSPEGTTIGARVTASAETFVIQISDEGIGIPAADRTRIFEPFERGSNVGNIKGTGLGLNIVKRMSELLGGTITVEPATPRGTVFTVTLPRHPVPPTTS